VSRRPLEAKVRLNTHQLDRLRRRMRHIAGVLEQGATSDNAAAHYRSELGALRQVVDAFEEAPSRCVETDAGAACRNAGAWTTTVDEEQDVCTADEAEEAA
jgi:hypothetical protein